MDEVRRPWVAVGGEPELIDAVEVTGSGPALPSVFPVTELAVGAVGAATLAVAALAHDRGGPPPRAVVDRVEAAVSFRSERYLRQADEAPAELWAPLSGDYRAADGWVRIHTNFDHHRDAALRAVGLPAGPDTARDELGEAVAAWAAGELVEAIHANGGAAAEMRPAAAWAEHRQGRAVADLPLVAMDALGDAPAEAVRSAPAGRPPSDRPLAGVRVLDLSRVIAGPVAGRFLAAYGADVLRVSSPRLPTLPALDLDTGFGKRSCFVGLDGPDGVATLEDLVRGADVFLCAYRPGALAARGFDPARLAELRPGIVVVELSAYGGVGPWGDRRGFDSLVQMASGIVATETAAAGVDRPRSLPCQALDHATGYLAALGAVAGIRRRVGDGGSWRVGVSLARTARWLDVLGRVRDGQATREPDPGPFLVRTGDLEHVRPPGSIPASPPRWDRPPPALGADPPAWE